jgi:hypothetical protein
MVSWLLKHPDKVEAAGALLAVITGCLCFGAIVAELATGSCDACVAVRGAGS